MVCVGWCLWGGASVYQGDGWNDHDDWWPYKKLLSPSSTWHIIITEEEEQGSTSKEGGWRPQKIVSSFPSRSRHRPRHKSKGTRLSRKKHKQSHNLDIQDYKEKGHFPKRFSMFRSEFGSYFRLNFFSSLIAVFADFRWWFLLLSMIAVCEVTSCE